MPSTFYVTVSARDNASGPLARNRAGMARVLAGKVKRPSMTAREYRRKHPWEQKG